MKAKKVSTNDYQIINVSLDIDDVGNDIHLKLRVPFLPIVGDDISFLIFGKDNVRHLMLVDSISDEEWNCIDERIIRIKRRVVECIDDKIVVWYYAELLD